MYMYVGLAWVCKIMDKLGSKLVQYFKLNEYYRCYLPDSQEKAIFSWESGDTQTPTGIEPFVSLRWTSNSNGQEMRIHDAVSSSIKSVLM